MSRTIAILDDENDRIQAMLAVLRQRFPKQKVVTFDCAPDMNDWLRDNAATCDLICLDHDLGPNRKRDGVVFDPGIGRDVADLLATLSPSCPIIIHTTNTDARPGMIEVLEEQGWTVTYVSPYDDVLWIGEVWISEVATALNSTL